ncbi:proton-conducting transporter membrane subunit [Iamia majanohamensis]|uniref:Proton-conducting transporter membrane subunit n=1 Tax=Iamia majanohamensis TaxID=467976 RepID=A0AAE9Y6W3_9ACTN|nr:proton-conducting transporter membrane subunit [Iamia majanohamensis]WCO68030.1 proton-conducting transporter membrane subunit [Iamia majanohamensis]
MAEVALLVVVALPVLAGLALWAWGDRPGAVLALGALGSLALTLGAAVLVAVDQPDAALRWGAGITLRVEVADLARAPIVLVAFVGLAVAAYALGYGEVRGRARIVGLLVAFVGTMELLLLAGDLLTLLVAWELVGLLSWALIAHHWRGDAPSQATHAFLATRLGDLGLFLAAGAAFAATGTFDLAALSGAHGGLLTVVVVGVLLAAVAKSAQLPFSPWLFAAMAGPTPASALLHSATMVAAGAYLLARLQPVLDGVGWFGPLTIGIGLVTALAGGLVAAVQPEAKKLLAASTSAHYGLMLVAVGAGYPAVAVAHLVAHGLFKALLFVSAGVAIDASGHAELADMRLGRRLPQVAALTAVGTLALAAVPPLGGAWTKEEVVAAGTHAAPWVGGLVVVAGALSAFYAARFQLLAYGRGDHEPDDADGPRLGGRRSATGAMVLLAGAGVLLGLVWTPWGEERVLEIAASSLPSSEAWEVPASLVALVLAGYAAVLLDRSRRLAVPSPGAGWARVSRWFDLGVVVEVAVVDPVLALARTAARFDDRVVDAGVRGVAAGGSGVSRLLARGDDRVVDAGIRGAARFGVWAAGALDRVGEVSLDGVVDGIARMTGAAGRDGRRLQSGQTHHYYAGIAVGLFVLVLVATAWR